MNKTIYMTYKKNIPDKVKNRWIKYNNDYKIDFSLDNDCLDFLKTNFNNNVSNLFSKIKKGMYSIKQAAVLAYECLSKILKKAGYSPIPATLGL